LTLGIGRIGAIAGPSYLAFAATTFDSPRAGFYAFVALAIIGAAVLTFIPRTKKPQIPVASIPSLATSEAPTK